MLFLVFLMVQSVITFSQDCSTTKVYPTTNQCDWIRSRIVDVENPNIGNATPGTYTVNLVFDSFSKYRSGITINVGTFLKLNMVDDTAAAKTGTCYWKLYMSIDDLGWGAGATTDEWNNPTTYGAGTTAPKPKIEDLKIKVYNSCSTPTQNGNWQNFTNDGDFLPIIDNAGTAFNGVVACTGGQPNSVGSYLGPDYNELTFAIDYKLIPTLGWTPGYYMLKIKYCLAEK